MINSDLLDCPNNNLLDSNVVGESSIHTRNAINNIGRRQDNHRNSYRRRVDIYSNVDAETIASIGTTAASLGGALASRQRNTAKDEAKQARKSQRKDNKSACGKKPLFKRKRAEWDKCVQEYVKTKNPTITPAESSQSYKPQSEQRPPKKESDDKILGMSKSVAIPVIVGVVAIAGFFIYKKFFAKSAGASSPSPSAVPLT